MTLSLLPRLFRGIENELLAWIDVDRYLPIQLDITNLCNLRCAHCYHPNHVNDGAIDLPEWINILNQYFVMITRLRFRPMILLCGGEPALSPHFRPLLDWIHKKNSKSRIVILTNGTLPERLSTDLLKRFSEVSVQISLDAPDAGSHDLIRGVGSFDKATACAKFLMSHGISAYFQAILAQNSASKIPAFFDLAKKVGVSHMSFTRLIQKDQPRPNSPAPLTPLALKSAYQSILIESARTGVRTHTNHPLYTLLHPGLGRSGRFWEGLVIDYQGQLLASSRSRLKLGSVPDGKLETLFFNHPIFVALRRGKIKVCGECPHFDRCGGDRNAAYAETGDYLAADPGCWLVSNIKTHPKSQPKPQKEYAYETAIS
ncbi:radical SAM protein [Bdellovibrionota bacterium FG-2]